MSSMYLCSHVDIKLAFFAHSAHIFFIIAGNKIGVLLKFDLT